MYSRTLSNCCRPIALFAIIFFAACGGGGGGAPPIGPPPAQMKTISGVVMLGPVSNADVEISGTGGTLGAGTTGADGGFGPISFSGNYNGPLRITVTGNANSMWICDFATGCGSGNTLYQPGASIPFDGTLEAVLPDAATGQFVSVSMLSNFVAAHMDVLGGLTAANVNAALTDIADMLRSVLGVVLNDLSLALSDDFSDIRILDLENLPAPGGANDALSAILTMFNSALMGLNTTGNTTGDFIAQISAIIASNPVLSVSDPDFSAPSLESFVSIFLTQVANIAGAADAVTAALEALLSPNMLVDLLLDILDTLAAMPRIQLDIPRPNPQEPPREELFVDDVALQGAIFREYEVTTSTAEVLQAGDYGVDDFELEAFDWLTASTFTNAGIPYVRIDVDNVVVGTMPNGTYQAYVDVYSNTGEFARNIFEVRMTLQVP